MSTVRAGFWMRARPLFTNLFTRVWRRPACALLLAACALTVAPRSSLASGEEGPRLALAIETPSDGAVLGDPGGTAFIAGNALLQSGAPAEFDVLFVIDQSASTAASSGSDINGDGAVDDHTCARRPRVVSFLGSLIGVCRPSKDSVFDSELAAVRTLLGQLDARSTRVGLVSFSGDGDALTPDSSVLSALTQDYAQVERGLLALEQRGPFGQTNMQAAVQTGVLELGGSRSAFSAPRPAAQKIMVFLTDGLPTLPIERAMDQNRRLAIEAAGRAAKLGIRIDTYGIGEEALSEPVEVVEMARISGGVFTPVTQPRDLQAIFEQLSFADIAELSVRNRTTERDARYVSRGPDGRFSALLDMVEGENTVEVHARSADGSEQRRRIRVHFLADADAPALSPELRARRNRLLENRLSDLQQRNLAIEAQRDEELRRALSVRIQEDRKQAEERVRRLLIQTGEPAVK